MLWNFQVSTSEGIYEKLQKNSIEKSSCPQQIFPVGKKGVPFISIKKIFEQQKLSMSECGGPLEPENIC